MYDIMKDLKMEDLIQELIKRGAVKLVNKEYSHKKAYIEERYTSHKIKRYPKKFWF